MEHINYQLSNNQIVRVKPIDKLSIEDAYLLGYLCGDGAILSRKNKKRRSGLSVTTTNKETVVFFHKVYQPESMISKNRHSDNPDKNIYATKMSYKLRFSTYYSELFEQYNILSLKKYRHMENIPQHLIKPYLLGLLDADGQISYGYRKDKDRLWTKIGYTHQSEKLFNQIDIFLKKELDIIPSIRSRKNEDCLDLNINKIDYAVKFIIWLYDIDFKEYNKRKYKKSRGLLIEYSKKFKQLSEPSGVSSYKLKDGRAKYTAFAFINGSPKITLKKTFIFDEAVKARIIFEATHHEQTFRQTRYNSLSKLYEIKYISHDDNKETILKVDLDGNIIEFKKFELILDNIK